MKKYIPRLLALLLALTLMLLAVACNMAPVKHGGNDDDDDETTDTSKITTTTDDDDDEPTYTTTPGTQPVTPPVGETTTPTVTSTPVQDPPSSTDPDEPTVEMLPSQEVKIVGINLLNGNAASVNPRAPAMVDLILSYTPDSIGVQECGAVWGTTLDTELGDQYARVGVDCLGNQNAVSFATYVYYLKDKYIAIDSGTFWMSKTPDVPSKYDNTVDMNRTTTWVILENVLTGFRYVHMNLHIDHKNLDVNEIQCQMILQQIRRFEDMGYPVFATGDYNMGEMTESYQIMTSQPTHVADARYVAIDSTDMISHPGNGRTIDYCFVTKQNMSVKEFKIVDTHATGTQLSDHRGTFTRALVNSLPKQAYSNSMVEFKATDKATVTLTEDLLTKIEFPQAKDAAGTPAHHYELQLLDRNNAILKNETVFGGYYLPTVVEKNTYSIALSTTNEKYILRITPISIFGQRGEPMIQWIKVEAPVVAPEAIGDPDLLQVQVQGGAVVDLSGKNYTTDTRGTTNVSGEFFSFGSNGNIKFTDFKQNDTTLADGFTLAVVAKLGDVNTKQTIVGNQHAGGYGMSVDEGKVSFSVHANGSYVTVTCAATANTEYHIVGVYNPEVGVLLYLNGQLVAVNAVGDDPEMGFATDAGAEYFCVGADSDASGNGEFFFKGSIKQVGIYSTPLTAGNVLHLYQHQ